MRFVNRRRADVVRNHRQDAACELGLFDFAAAGINTREIKIDCRADQRQQRDRKRDGEDKLEKSKGWTRALNSVACPELTAMGVANSIGVVHHCRPPLLDRPLDEPLDPLELLDEEEDVLLADVSSLDVAGM